MQQLNFEASLDPISLPINAYFAHEIDASEITRLFAHHSDRLTIDIETYGLNSTKDGLNPYQNQIRLVQIQFSSDEILLIDLKEETNRDAALNLLKTVANSRSAIKIFHNAYFDIINLTYHFGIKFNNVRDTQIMSTMLYAGIKKYRHSLKDCVERELDQIVDKAEQTSDWSREVLTGSQVRYAIKDVQYTTELYLHFRSKCLAVDGEESVLKKPCTMRFSDIVIIECCAVPAFVDITLNGLPVDLNLAREIQDKYKRALSEIKKPFEDATGISYTAASKVVRAKIKELFGLTLEIKSSKEGGGNSDTLETANSAALFAASKECPILLNLMLARTLKQHLDAVSRIIKVVESYADGRLRGWFRPLGTTGTGRSTCSDGGRDSSFAGINIQNIPKKLTHPLLDKYELPPIRSCIRSEKGKSLAVIDLAASHQRLVASSKLSGDRFLQKVLLDPVTEKLSHAILAADIAQLKGITITPEELESRRKKEPALDTLRNISKVRFYSGLNKAGWRTVKARLQKDYIDCSDDDAKASSKAFDSRYEGVVEFQEQIQRAIASSEFQIDLDDQPFVRFRTVNGRVFYCPKYESSYSHNVQAKISDALAIQWLDPEATAMKIAMIVFREQLEIELCDYPNWGKLVSMCHDELVLEVDDDCQFITATLARIIAESFQYVLGDDLPHGVELNPNKLEVSNYSEK